MPEMTLKQALEELAREQLRHAASDCQAVALSEDAARVLGNAAEVVERLEEIRRHIKTIAWIEVTPQVFGWEVRPHNVGVAGGLDGKLPTAVAAAWAAWQKEQA